MNRRSVPIAALVLCASAVLAAPDAVSAAPNDTIYVVGGSDAFKVGHGDVKTEIAYHGTETLHVTRVARGRRYAAHADYERDDQGARTRATASYETTVAGDGEQRDGTNRDPDYLTVLNQPFAVQLDGPTVRDLARLRGSVPFDFPSPMTGATLHGSLRRLPDAVINGARVLGVAFTANGPLHGPLPDHPEMALDGTIAMRGTAYYTYADALLLALDATLTIGGSLDDRERKAPVEITYKRSMRVAGDGTATARR